MQKLHRGLRHQRSETPAQGGDRLRGFWHKEQSVFFCVACRLPTCALAGRLYDLINLQEDEVLFIPLCGKSCSASRPWPTEAVDAKDVVIVT